jgi:hypothetical protein
LTKDEAYKEAIRRWRELPVMERQTYTQAQVFAASLADELDFRTMGNERKVIAAWLVRDIIAAQAAGKAGPRNASGPGTVIPLKEAAMSKSRQSQQVEDASFLAQEFDVPPAKAAKLVTPEGGDPSPIEDKLHDAMPRRDNAVDDLTADNDETPLKPVLKGENKRTGAG